MPRWQIFLGDLIAAGCRHFHTQREIRRLLDLDQETAGPDGMRDAAFDQEGVAGPGIKAMQAIQHRFHILAFEKIPPTLTGDPFLETDIHGGRRTVPPPVHDGPAFGFSKTAFEIAQGGRLVGMHLDGQPLCGVDEFKQDLDGRGPAQDLRIAPDVVHQRLAVLMPAQATSRLVVPGCARGPRT
jgi:hypothetical protein